MPSLASLFPLALLLLLLPPEAAAQHASSTTATTSGPSTPTSSPSPSSSSSSSSGSGSSSSSTSGAGITYLTGTRRLSTSMPTGLYQTPSSQITLGGGSSSAPEPSSSGNVTSGGVITTVSGTVTFLTGSIQQSSTMSGNFSTSASASSTAPHLPQNTQPCNNYVEFCERRYSNITMVAAHNSPFVRKGSAAANQELPVTDQLNDGVRLLQAQMHWPANSSVPHFCHTSCDILDAGPITTWLSTVNDWVASHPYDVVTVLLENGNYSKPELYVPFIEQTGITRYTYQPPVFPMKLDDWPPLAEMILTGKRVVMFMDYNANETKYPWLLDEFSQMWQTPFDPTNRSFPCTEQRPPNLARKDAEDMMYMINHNLNVEVSLLGTSILVPAISLLNTTNNVTGYGSLGVTANQCRSDWGRPPNFLDVDYYNYGGFPGSVFEVAAMMNNVTYNRPCCGIPSLAGAGVRVGYAIWALVAAVSAWVML